MARRGLWREQHGRNQGLCATKGVEGSRLKHLAGDLGGEETWRCRRVAPGIMTFVTERRKTAAFSTSDMNWTKGWENLASL